MSRADAAEPLNPFGGDIGLETIEDAARPAPRSIREIFDDLRALSQSDGALHEISGIIYRDWVITVDAHEGRVVEPPEHRWSTSRLNNNELVLLLGLLVQSSTDRTYTVLSSENSFAERADTLLREFHDRLLVGAVPTFDSAGTLIENPDSLLVVAREAMYYGADSFYLHQFPGFTRQRYREDGTWLLQKVGLSIRPIIDIARYIVNRVNAQMTNVGHGRKQGHEFSVDDLTNSLLVAKADVRQKFGAKVDAFFAKFVTPAVGANAEFTDPFAINAAATAPIIDLGEFLYIPNQYRLFQTIYESPFYWMIADKAYVDTEAEHRGAFLEKTAVHILRSVFGAENVYENVKLKQKTHDVAGEIDALVVYGEFVIVVQAKSKRVTMKARAGDMSALKNDFEGAIQAPYRQALDCIDLIKSGARCVTQGGQDLTFHALPRFFPLVVLSDPFPGSTFLSHAMINRDERIAPVIWDIGVLDCVARVLPTPIEMLFYLKSRSDVFDKVMSDSEYNFLGYHLRAKLALPADVHGMLIDRDFATIIDDYMVAADVGVEAVRPLGILESVQIPVVSELLSELKTADPRIAAVVIDLYDFSHAALENLSATILKLRKEVSTTGKAFKAFSVPTAAGGFTYAVTRQRSSEAASAAQLIGSKHKYDTRSDRWYVVLDSIETENPIDGLLLLVWPWEEDQREASNSEWVASNFRTRQVGVDVTDPTKKSANNEVNEN